MRTHTLTTVLKADAAANVLGGIALIAAGGALAGPVGIATAWPIRLVGIALIVYGIENLLVSRRLTVGGLTSLAAVDLVFAVAVLGLAIVDPTSAETWIRWAFVVVAELSATMGIAKILGLRARSVQRAAQPVQR